MHVHQSAHERQPDAQAAGTNMSKIVASWSDGMPTPVSLTITVT